METKWCRRCKQERPLEEFRVDHRKKDGHYASCRLCCRSQADRRLAQRPPVVSKVCSGCQQELPAECFGVDWSMRDGLRAKCQECRRKEGQGHFAGLSAAERQVRLERTAQWRKDHPEAYKASYIKSSRRQKYGIDIEVYEQMLEKQGHCCAICGRPEHARTNGQDVDCLSVDHDHKTGAVRELLCSGCNKGLGYFQDDPNLLQAAIAYLRKHSKG